MSYRYKLTPRKLPRQERSRVTVEAILIATARELVRRGPDFNINRVAEVAGVSIGSLYQYFPSKESLVATLLLGQEEFVVDSLALGLGSVDGAEQIAAKVSQALLAPWVRDPELYEALLASAEDIGAERKLQEVREQGRLLVHDLLDDRGHPQPELGAFVVMESGRRVVAAVLGSDRDWAAAENLEAVLCGMIEGALGALDPPNGS